jgi:HEAT repeat protein
MSSHLFTRMFRKPEGVAQTSSLPYRRLVVCWGQEFFRHLADWKSAIQQTGSLRYDAGGLLLAGLLAFVAATASADEEQDLIGTLQSSATAPQKCTACQRLRVVGTTKSIPALAALLVEERTAQAARYTLEGMPYPDATLALRQAVATTTGPIQAGLIDSVGWRHDAAAVPMLKKLLRSKDPMVASAAACALGRIGGKDAIAALSSARSKVAPAVQPVVLESLLACAEGLLAAGDTKGAAKLYRGMFVANDRIRVAAWRGLAMADASQRAKMVAQALAGQDRPMQVDALKVVRELNDPAVVTACLRQWQTLPAECQLAVLDARVKVGGDVLPTVRRASQSPYPSVRVAAWLALGDLGDAKSVPALAKAAAHGEVAERDAARDALARLHGTGVREALLQNLAGAEPQEKAELLRALGERGDTGAADLLVQNAAAGPTAVRLAALDALRKLAVPATATPILEIAAKSESETNCEPALKALYPVCQASPDKAQTSRSIVEAMSRMNAAERRRVLPVLSELGTPVALEAAQAATRDPDPELVKEAVRVLAQWTNSAPAAGLLELARASSTPTLQVLALRGCIEVAALDPDPARRLALLQDAKSAARRPDEKKQALGKIGQIATPEALQVVMGDLSEPGLANEAGLAAMTIAEKLATSNTNLATETATKVLAQCKTPELVKRAWVIRGKPVSPGPFIQDWVVCGPYRQAGANGSEAVFNIAFAPEKRGAKVQWKALPRGEHLNLAASFPAQDNCAAYLKTQVIAPEECEAALLLGSDDGVKAWLNGAVVHSNNTNRGDVADQDMAPIQLKKGTNDLMLKISQGGGGWSASARIVGADGKPIAGVEAAPPAGAAPLKAMAAAAPTPATLPQRDNFRKLRLSDEFYAEGAYYGDFNRDRKMDIVAGPYWFEGPDFQKRHEYRSAKAFDPKNYSDNFLTYVGDFNGDGWPDVLCVPFPGKEGYWYENPAGKDGQWKQHLAYGNIGNESPVWGEVEGKGRPALVFCKDGYLGYAGADPAKPDQPWVFHAVSHEDKRYQKFTHGAGLGDINGDGRLDILEALGWWEQPAHPLLGQPWTFHPFYFAEEGAQMLVYDVNGDGLADIITAWHCHHYGLVWWEQVKAASGQEDWKKHMILSATPDLNAPDFRPSQMHALDLVDMNGDGLKDVLTGKRFWAHGPTGDKEPDAPAVVMWFELRRDGKDGATFVPHLIDDDSGVGTQVTATDLNRDRRPDVIVANKKGIFVHLSQPAPR